MSSRITGIIIASGYSGRMNSFKPLLLFEGLSFISGIMLKLGLVCDSITIVVGHQKELVEDEIQKTLKLLSASKNKPFLNFANEVRGKTKLIINENFDHGMFTSLQRGLSAAHPNEWYLYHFVDQPGLPIKFYHDFTHQILPTYKWIQPVFHGKNSHPILFNSSIKDLILKADYNKSLKDISRSVYKLKKFWECGYEQVLMDIDTPEDYDTLLAKESESLTNQLIDYLSKN